MNKIIKLYSKKPLRAMCRAWALIAICLLASLTQGFAQQDSLPQTGVRELGTRSITDYEQQNNMGIPNKSLNDLNISAAQLKAIVVAAGIPDFKVFDYTAYSLIGRFKEPEKWNEWAFSAMDSIIRTGAKPKYGYKHYLLIAKEIDPSNGKVKYRVKLSLPTVENPLRGTGGNDRSVVAMMTDAELTEISNAIQTSLYSDEDGATQFVGDEKPMKNGLNTAKKLIVQSDVIEIWADDIEGLSILSPDGKIVKPLNSKKLSYGININNSAAGDYCYLHSDFINVCLPWSNNTADGYGYEFHVYANKHYEPPFMPEQGKTYKVALFERINRCFVKLYSVNWTTNDVANFPNSLLAKTKTYLGEIKVCDKSGVTDSKKKVLQNWLKSLNAEDTEIRVSKCNNTSNQEVITTSSINANKGEKKIMINLCLEGNGEWKVNWHGFAPNALVIPTGFKGTVAEVIKISDQKAIEMMQRGGVPKTKVEGYDPTEVELEYKKLGIIEGLIELKELTKKLCNEAKIPEKFWNPQDPLFTNAPAHAFVFSGGGDAVIGELKSIPELISFGLELGLNPSEIQKIFNSIKDIKPAQIKKMLIAAAQSKKDKYTGDYRLRNYEMGKDATSIAMAIITGGGVKNMTGNLKDIKNLKKAAKGIDELAESTAGKLDEALDIDAGKNLIKKVNDGDIHPNMLNYEADDLAAAQKKKGSKLDKKESDDIIEENKKYIGEGDLDEIPRNSKTLPDGTIEIEKGQKGGWNKTLNKPLEPNSKYKVGKNTYETDATGRVKGVKGELDLKDADRNNYQQRKGVTSKDGVDGDQGGHLIAAIFDGAGEQINYVPMKGNLNQGAWKSMENTWANALKANKKVEVDVKIIYGNGKRPIGFEVDYKIDGVKQSPEIFNN
jgi:hypothetical protein